MHELAESRIVHPMHHSVSERVQERALRPTSLNGYVGQAHIKAQLSIFLRAASQRQAALDHLLLSGPPGLGKTTLAHIVAHELGVQLKATSGPVLEKAGDIAALLTQLEARDILFIDEIHRLSPVIEELLYAAMEDYQLDILIGEGPAARSIKLDLPPFTLIGATTRAGALTAPLRDRFGILQRLDFYSVEELTQLIRQSAECMQSAITLHAAQAIAQCSRGTPRIANRLLRRVVDVAQVRTAHLISTEIVTETLELLKINAAGFDPLDQRFLKLIIEQFSGGPVGLETLVAALSESRETIEEVIEPYLLQQGFIQKTPRGRLATPHAYAYLGLTGPHGIVV